MQRNNRKTLFQQFLDTFPSSVHEHLQTIPQSGGMLAAGHCRAVRETLKISDDDLMLRLLPMARLYSLNAISGFQVGAVAKTWMSDKTGGIALFLGANIEFPAQALTQTIHAEQAAVINAWLQGAGQIDTIAVTAAPCGYCRQFLYELEGSHMLTVVLQQPDNGEVTKYNLSDLLPQAFGPRQLGSKTGFMASGDQQPDLSLQLSSEDPLVLKALAAAGSAYAPYSHNLAGCAIEAGNDKIYAGRYAENAAFNPSLSPLHTAIIRMNMDNVEPGNKITRVVLAEKPTSISQRAVCELLLRSVAPEVILEYFEAK